MLDRRRLEDAFLLLASIEVMKKYNLQLENILCNRNGLSELVVGEFHDAFVKKWGGQYHYYNVVSKSNISSFIFFLLKFNKQEAILLRIQTIFLYAVSS